MSPAFKAREAASRASAPDVTGAAALAASEVARTSAWSATRRAI
jgi:hypothetical protein